MQTRTDIRRETDTFLYGTGYHRLSDDDPWICDGEFIQLKETLWFTREPHAILAAMGITTEPRRAQELSYLFDGQLSGYYYVAAASDGTDEAIKWILAALDAHLHETGQTISQINRIMPADYLRDFVASMKSGKFAKSFAKDVFAVLLAQGEQFANIEIDGTPEEVMALIQGDVWTRRLTGSEVMDRIIADPRFKAADSSAIDAIIESVIAANPDNVAKAKENPKLIQWFVGQVMKAAKGAAPASVVLEKLTARLG